MPRRRLRPASTMLPNLALLLLSLTATVPPVGGPSDGRIALDPYLPASGCARGEHVVYLDPGGGEVRVQANARGELSNTRHERGGNYCAGYSVDEPQICVIIAARGWYRLEVVSAEGVDTTLSMVDEADETSWCDDDGGNGLLSRIEQELPAGVYSVWVGTFGSGNSAEFELRAGPAGY